MKVYLPYYRIRTRLERLINGVPHVDARWIGDLMGRLSPELIADAIRDACYTQEQVSIYAYLFRLWCKEFIWNHRKLRSQSRRGDGNPGRRGRQSADSGRGAGEPGQDQQTAK
jgi:hypothetical protein